MILACRRAACGAELRSGSAGRRQRVSSFPNFSLICLLEERWFGRRRLRHVLVMSAQSRRPGLPSFELLHD
jgi:hypothetical protein